MPVNIKPIISSACMFIFFMCSYMSIKKSTIYAKRKILFDIIFAVLFGLAGVYSSFFGYLLYKEHLYSMIFIIVFMSGILFDLKCGLIVLIITILNLFTDLNVVNNKLLILTNIIVAIYSFLIGYICHIKLYKKTLPSIISSFMYSIILTTGYMLTTLIVSFNNEDIYIFDTANAITGIKTIQNTVSLLIIFIILNVFYKKQNNQESSNLFHKIFTKFCIMLLVLYVVLVICSGIFYYKYTFSMAKVEIMLNYEIAKDISNKFKKVYGDDFMDSTDPIIKSAFKNWIVGDGGVTYIIDKNGNILNEIAKQIQDYYKYDVYIPKKFDGIDEYKQDTCVEYIYKNYSINLIYFNVGNYKIIILVPDAFISKKAYLAGYIASYTIVVVIMSMFILVYILLKYFVINKIQKINDNLKMISDGNYDIVFNDKSSTELNELSESINKTVETLKSNLIQITNKNKEELDLAKKIQSEQLPIPERNYIGYEAYAKNIPAEDVGGDFFGIFSLDVKTKMFLIADASGKGIPAAMFMMKAIHTIVNFAKQNLTLDMVMENTNKVLCSNNDAMMFVTCFICFLDIDTGILNCINAGHNKPIFSIFNGNEIEHKYIDSKICPIIGIDENSKYESWKIKLNEGDSLFLYTDGVTESRNINREFFGENKLFNLIKNNFTMNPRDLCDKVLSEVSEFSKGAKQHDDITVLSMKYVGRHNKIKLNAIYSDVIIGQAFLDRFIEACNISISDKRNLKVVYDEILNNIIKHAYNYKDGEIIFELNLINNDETIEMIFKDKGPEFNPVTYECNENVEPEDRINGGMGIMFCKNIMDKCEYFRENEYNVLKMYKKIS